MPRVPPLMSTTWSLKSSSAMSTHLAQQLLQHVLCLRVVTAAEQIEMIEHVIQVIERLARGVAGVERPGLAIGGVEARGKSAEQFAHGDIGLAVAEVHRRVEDHRLAARGAGGVAAPEI